MRVRVQLVLMVLLGGVAAGCGGDDGSPPPSTTATPTVAELLTADVYSELASGRGALGGQTKDCAATSFKAAATCVAGQFVPILGKVNPYLSDLKAARASVTGECAAALERSIVFQAAQAGRIRAIIAQARRTTTEQQFTRLNGLITANGNAAKENDAARTAAPEQDWAAACQPQGATTAP